MNWLGRYGAWIPVLTGLSWLAYAGEAGVIGYGLGVVPGGLLLATGVAVLLWPGDPRPLQAGSLAAGLCVPLAGLALFWAGPLGGLWLAALSVLSFVCFGAVSIEEEISHADLPEPERSLALAAWVAGDEALLGFVIPLAVRSRHEELQTEGAAALRYWHDQGWIERPAAYHQRPPALEGAELRSKRVHGFDFEHLSFRSGWEPHSDEPGGERYMGYTRNHTAQAWVLRSDPARPWLICVHGLGMGRPEVDLFAFRARTLHHKLGLNLLLPVLPFHGPRGGRLSGHGYLSERILDTVHAFAQGVWDTRRMLSWIRDQGARRVGVYGMSLGGTHASLIASLADDLDCVIAGVPLVDFSQIAWKHAPPAVLARFERAGLDRRAFEELMRPVAPLALEPRVPHAHRYIFAGSVDRLTPPQQARALWEHWQRPGIQWYPGSHIGFLLQPPVNAFIQGALTASGLVGESEA